MPGSKVSWMPISYFAATKKATDYECNTDYEWTKSIMQQKTAIVNIAMMTNTMRTIMAMLRLVPTIALLQVVWKSLVLTVTHIIMVMVTRIK